MRKDIKKAKRSLFLWTVNDEKTMKWSIRKEVDGVITDDPKKYLEVCESYAGEPIHFSLLAWLKIIFSNIMSRCILLILYWYDFNIQVGKDKPLVIQK